MAEKDVFMVENMSKFVVGAVAGLALCFSSSVASAATMPVSNSAFAPSTISPFIVLSAFGTMQSGSAVCAAAVGAAAASAAAQGQVPAQGCVLPVLDPVAAVPIETPPVAYAPVATQGSGLGIFPLLLGLALVAGLAAALLSGGDDDDDRLPISPS